MDDSGEFTDEQLRGDAPADSSAETEGEAPKADRVASDLEQGIDSLKNVAVGVAARLFGPKLVNEEPARPSLSPEADKLVEDVGATVGHYLRAAGTALKDHPRSLNEAGREAQELAKEPVKKEVEDGWSPLVQGVRVFSEGLGVVVNELADRVQQKGKGGEE